MDLKIALIRGINVTGHRKLPMAELRELCSEIGLADSVTYIQSGNVLFRSSAAEGSIERKIASAIADRYGYTVSVLVRDPDYLHRVVAANPFGEKDEKFLHVTLLSGIPDEEAINELSAADYGQDGFVAGERAVYVHCPSGYGTTKLTNNFFEAKLGVSATTRNWRTMNKLIGLALDKGWEPNR